MESVSNFTLYDDAPERIALGHFPNRCTQFASTVDIPQAVVNFAEYVPEGTLLDFSSINDPSCVAGIPEPNEQTAMADMCRISFTVATSEDSEIMLEAWLPQRYNGRFLSVGNRGLSGCIRFSEMVLTSSMGFATVGANGGHNGTSGEAFLNQPDILEDFSYRSLHTSAEVGKSITDQFYPRGHKKSYYLGCSTGGRQGFKAAQSFPEDFDGIIAGAPAIGMTKLVAWGFKFYFHTGPPEAPSFLSPEDWALVHDEVLRQCDGLDGTLDGLLDDPSTCDFYPETLICGSSNSGSPCLSAAQAKAVRGIFSPTYDTQGNLAFPAFQPGLNTKDYVPFYFAGVPFQISVEWARYVAYNDSNWDPLTYTIQDLEFFKNQNPFGVDSFDGDLSAFQNRGGKLLSYHGLQDFVITSEISSTYYAHVAETMGKPVSDLGDFYRLFYVSGMEHCTGGPGYTSLGQDLGFVGSTRAGRNIIMDMVRWVERGEAPDVLMGAKLGEDGEPVGWKPHCKWPLKSRFVAGAGGERRWRCVETESLGAASPSSRSLSSRDEF